LPFGFNTPLLPKSSDFRGGEYGGKTVICQRAALIPLGKLQRALARRPAGEPSFNQDM
jgi:hypothetical protein